MHAAHRGHDQHKQPRAGGFDRRAGPHDLGGPAAMVVDVCVDAGGAQRPLQLGRRRRLGGRGQPPPGAASAGRAAGRPAPIQGAISVGLGRVERTGFGDTLGSRNDLGRPRGFLVRRICPCARTMIVAEPISSECHPAAAGSPARAPTAACPARNDSAATTNSSAQSRPSPFGNSGAGHQRLESKARLTSDTPLRRASPLGLACDTSPHFARGGALGRGAAALPPAGGGKCRWRGSVSDRCATMGGTAHGASSGLNGGACASRPASRLSTGMPERITRSVSWLASDQAAR